ELYAIFQFDRAFRNIIFKNLLIVENNLKSIISYELSKKYGITEKDYLNPNNFTSDSIKIRQVSDVLNKIKRQIRVNGKQHSATLHYISNYGFIPLWVLVKVLSFGMINELYDILKSNDQIELAAIYNLDSETFGLYISLLANYRNLCAHEDILYDHKTQREIADTKYHRELNIETLNDEYVYGKNDLFALVIMMKYMLRSGDFREMVNEISYELDTLDGKIETISQSKILDKMGFPDNWKEIQNIN
ncbi:MAG TPA: Abi family protein, partial [Bacilli bacterium]|nr:Abi family protein [Bacilli bacterium]